MFTLYLPAGFPTILLAPWVTIALLLVHELAHIHRRDHIVGLIQRLAVALYWWNPLVHAASRELSVVREQICDDLATSVTAKGESSQRREYAAMLVDLAERATERRADRLGIISALAAWNGPGDDLTRRIQRLLDPGRNMATSLSKIGRIGISAFALGMLFLVMALNVRIENLLASAPEEQGLVAAAATDRANHSAESAKIDPGEANEDTQSIPWLEKKVLVLNQDSEPIPGAMVTPWGMMTRNAGMAWTDGFRTAKPISYTTNEQGIARIEFPKYAVVRERIAPENLTCRIEHPDYASSNMESVSVTEATLSQTVTIRMTPGAQVEMTPLLDGRKVKGGQLLVDWSERAYNPQLTAAITEDGTARLPRWSPGIHLVRAIFASDEGRRYYSSVQQLELAEGEELKLTVHLEPGVEVRGRLSDTVPRPVINGRVVAVASNAAESAASLTWYSHAMVDEAGKFSLEPMPRGTLQVIALCEGFMAKSGTPPREATEQERVAWEHASRPQIFTVEDATLDIIVEMTPTATARIHVTGPNEQPISQAQVGFSPNIAWWRGGSQLYGFPLLSSWEMLINPRESFWQWNDTPYSVLTNDDGVAVIKDLPPGPQMLFVAHDQFQLSTTEPNSLARFERVELTANEEYNGSLVLEPRVGQFLGDSVSMTENIYCRPGVSHITKPRPKYTLPTEAAETELAGVVVDVEGRPLAGVPRQFTSMNGRNRSKRDAFPVISISSPSTFRRANYPSRFFSNRR